MPARRRYLRSHTSSHLLRVDAASSLLRVFSNEWKRVGKRKAPYRLFLDNDIFSLAGIYTNIKDERGGEIPHYAIVTTTANELMAPVHNRMPVIINRADERSWISDSLTDADLMRLLQPYPAQQMQSYEISSLVNSPRNDGPAIIRPVA